MPSKKSSPYDAIAGVIVLAAVPLAFSAFASYCAWAWRVIP